MALVTSSVVSAGVGLASAAKGIASSRKASKEARAARKQQDRLITPQVKLAELQNQIFEEEGVPLIRTFLSESQQAGDITPELENISADVENEFARTRERQQRDLGRLGIQADDARAVALRNDLELARAATEVGLRNRSRRQARENRLNRLGQAVNVARGAAAESVDSFSRLSNSFGLRSQNALSRQSAADRAALEGLNLGVSSFNELADNFGGGNAGFGADGVGDFVGDVNTPQSSLGFGSDLTLPA